MFIFYSVKRSLFSKYEIFSVFCAFLLVSWSCSEPVSPLEGSSSYQSSSVFVLVEKGELLFFRRLLFGCLVSADASVLP